MKPTIPQSGLPKKDSERSVLPTNHRHTYPSECAQALLLTFRFDQSLDKVAWPKRPPPKCDMFWLLGREFCNPEHSDHFPFLVHMTSRCLQMIGCRRSRECFRRAWRKFVVSRFRYGCPSSAARARGFGTVNERGRRVLPRVPSRTVLCTCLCGCQGVTASLSTHFMQTTNIF